MGSTDTESQLNLQGGNIAAHAVALPGTLDLNDATRCALVRGLLPAPTEPSLDLRGCSHLPEVVLAADLGLLRSDTFGLCCHLFAELEGEPRAPNNANSTAVPLFDRNTLGLLEYLLAILVRKPCALDDASGTVLR